MTTKIIAHRGASKLAPENTMPAFRLAHELGSDGIETDVQLTKDNVPVLIHDEHVKRTTNGIGYIKDLTINQVKQLDAGSWFSKKYAGTSIITLEEFLHWIKPKPLYLNIELKNNKIDYKNIETIVYEMVKHYQLLNRTTLSTFNPNSVKRINKLHSDIKVAFLTSRNKNLISYAQSLGANALHVKYRLLNRLLVEQCQKANMKIRVYTLNRPSRILKSYALKCDGIFTDVPNIAQHYRKLFKEKNK
ncbi:glycerophosphodiester phosphodiesterase [Virgibacillus oceani]|uniref:Glycerophosphoryl diester phosphodiesterase n=1 Tax=Virgibacillus oceani TaxID=1479511 RepID=A0A917H160_9BACI|nr:glycerophosphoryl diester phosphodiesterase [Virgibacillus oceani]